MNLQNKLKNNAETATAKNFCVLTVVFLFACLFQTACGEQQQSVKTENEANAKVNKTADSAANDLKTPAKNDVSGKTNSTPQPLVTTAEKRLIGTIKAKAEDGYGCYFVPPADVDKISSKRNYLLLVDDDDTALMNIDGRDVKLKPGKSAEAKRSAGKKFVWNFSSEEVKVELSLTETETSNEGENSHYDAVIKIQKGATIESVKAKGFCGG